jgi:hypothetical protein
MGPRERIQGDYEERLERGDSPEVLLRDEAERTGELLQRARELRSAASSRQTARLRVSAPQTK